MNIRRAMLLPGTNDPGMVGIVRAFRLAVGASVYIEVGTRDKGNIAWVCKFLSVKASIIDVDLVQIEAAVSKLKDFMLPTQDIKYIQGNSVEPKTLKAISQSLDGRLADIIFLDSSHMYSHFLTELESYWDFVKPGGFILVHDIFWEGNEQEKGKSQAAAAVDRFIPVHVVSNNEPVHRYLPKSKKTPSWGGVGIIVKP